MDIIHQPERLRFVYEAEGEIALVEYRYVNETTVDFHHTFVPPTMRKHGLALKLVDAAGAWAKTQQFQIEASCWFAHKRLLGK